MKSKILSVILFLQLVLGTQTSSQAQTQAENLKILSWNIYMLPWLSWFNGNGHRAKVIGEELVNSDYQIIVFQEAFSIKCRKIIKKRLSEKYPYQYGPCNNSLSSLRSNSGLWVLSKFPLTQLKTIQFKESKTFDSFARKGAALFEGEFNGKRFQLLATHLQSSTMQDVRDKQYKEISDLLADYYTADVPQILCGDFNTDMSEKTEYETMIHTLNADNGSLNGDTQVTCDDAKNTFSKQNSKGKVIDYVLTRNTSQIASIDRRILEFYHADAGYKSNLSDHYALEATLSFVPNQFFVANK